LHGEAIGWGIYAATLLGLAMGRIPESDATRIIRSVASVGPLPALGKIPLAQLRRILAGDKKARAGEVRWVIPQRIGKVQRGVEVPWRLIARTILELRDIDAKARG
jgi:3-dehydroquinate synthase